MMAREHGMTRSDLLFVLAIAVIAPALVLPALSATRQGGGKAVSADNLRLLGAAHLVYAADWNGRQLTFVDDLISTYGSGVGDAFFNYWIDHGAQGQRSAHPPVALGWGLLSEGDEQYGWLAYRTHINTANASLTLPISFGPAVEFFGSFRMPNAVQYHQYLNGRFYDPLFYAPLDDPVVEAIGEGFDIPGEYWRFANVSDRMGNIPAWSSYCMSPAAMFDPAVMRHDDPGDDEANGFVDPWTLRDGFASPSFFQATYPSLKSQMIEHHWLQNPPERCNDAFLGTYGDDECEPYYFNHGFDSRPLALFYDGRVAQLPVIDAILADERVREQNNPNWGLWSQDTRWGADGYLSDFGYDGAQTSFHILTTDGILGRDVTAAAMDSPGHGERMRSRRREIAPRWTVQAAPDAAEEKLSMTDD